MKRADRGFAFQQQRGYLGLRRTDRAAEDLQPDRERSCGHEGRIHSIMSATTPW